MGRPQHTNDLPRQLCTLHATAHCSPNNACHSPRITHRTLHDANHRTPHHAPLTTYHRHIHHALHISHRTQNTANRTPPHATAHRTTPYTANQRTIHRTPHTTHYTPHVTFHTPPTPCTAHRKPQQNHRTPRTARHTPPHAAHHTPTHTAYPTPNSTHHTPPHTTGHTPHNANRTAHTAFEHKPVLPHLGSCSALKAIFPGAPWARPLGRPPPVEPVVFTFTQAITRARVLTRDWGARERWWQGAHTGFEHKPHLGSCSALKAVLSGAPWVRPLGRPPPSVLAATIFIYDGEQPWAKR